MNDWLQVNRAFRRLVLGLGVLTLIMTIGSLFGAFHWTLDVLTHFTLSYVFVLGVCILAGLLLRMRWWAVALFVVGMIPNVVILYPYFVGGGHVTAAEGESLTFLTMNISTEDDHYPMVTDAMLASGADVVALVEVRQDLLDHIAATVSDEYPYVYANPSRHTMGLALVSKIPFADAQLAEISRRETERGTFSKQYLDVTLDWSGELVRLFVVHPFPPMSGTWAASRNQEFAVFAEHAADVDTPLVMLGDFNAAPWSAPVQELTATTDLRPANLGFGVRPTWFFALVAQAPLDYLLVSDELVVTAYQTGKQFGSDHLPVTATLRLAAS